MIKRDKQTKQLPKQHTKSALAQRADRHATAPGLCGSMVFHQTCLPTCLQSIAAQGRFNVCLVSKYCDISVND